MHHKSDAVSVPLVLALSAIGTDGTPSLADDAAALMGTWRVPPYEQERFRMSDQCQRHADTDTQRVDESKVEVFKCDDPKYAAVKARILDYVHQVNPIYRREGHPLIPRRSPASAPWCESRSLSAPMTSATRARICASSRSGAARDLEHQEDQRRRVVLPRRQLLAVIRVRRHLLLQESDGRPPRDQRVPQMDGGIAVRRVGAVRLRLQHDRLRQVRMGAQVTGTVPRADVALSQAHHT